MHIKTHHLLFSFLTIIVAPLFLVVMLSLAYSLVWACWFGASSIWGLFYAAI